MTTRKTNEYRETVRTSAGLRETMFEAIDALRFGDKDPAHLRALAMACNATVNTWRIDLDVAKYIGANPTPKAIGEPHGSGGKLRAVPCDPDKPETGDDE